MENLQQCIENIAINTKVMLDPVRMSIDELIHPCFTSEDGFIIQGAGSWG
jgi:hypothetical protein